MDLSFSFVIPVYNRVEELRELLQSMLELKGEQPYEIIVVEDGSEQSSEQLVKSLQYDLPILYLSKNNTGPGDSRNFGMEHANGTYFLILDSDCLLPPGYLQIVRRELQQNYADCFGGPDDAHPSFSDLQKAINYAMTSGITTGGIRGKRNAARNFQPRSFNMGLSKKAFEASGGFGNVHPGEDPELSIRLRKLGFSTRLIPEAVVYHKRRISLSKFYEQVMKFGLVRPLISHWHPESKKFVYWLPGLFCLGMPLALAAMFMIPLPYGSLPALLYLLYFMYIFWETLMKFQSFMVSFLSMTAVLIQFTGYGYGFLKSTFLVTFSRKNPEQLFPGLFFPSREKSFKNYKKRA